MAETTPPDVAAAVTAVMQRYLDARYTGDRAALEAVFHPAAVFVRTTGGVDGTRGSVDTQLEHLTADRTPASFKQVRNDRIGPVTTLTSTAAAVSAEARWRNLVITDLATVVCVLGRWQVMALVSVTHEDPLWTRSIDTGTVPVPRVIDTAGIPAGVQVGVPDAPGRPRLPDMPLPPNFPWPPDRR